MGVKYGDIAKDTKDTFEKDFYTAVKIEDKKRAKDNEVTVLPKWDGKFATKWVYKWGLPADTKAEATCDAAGNSSTSSLKLTKGPWQVTGTVAGCDKYTSEVQVTEDVAGATVNATVKSNLNENTHAADVNVAYTQKVQDGTKVQVGAKAAVKNLANIDPTYEAALGIYATPGNLSVGYDVNAQKLKTYSVFGVPLSFGGFSWKIGHLFSMAKGATDNVGAVVVAKKCDYTVKTKVENMLQKPKTSVSVIVNSKPVEGSKESVTTVATWGFSDKGHTFGFYASRA